jgi:hypothetical protein
VAFAVLVARLPLHSERGAEAGDLGVFVRVRRSARRRGGAAGGEIHLPQIVVMRRAVSVRLPLSAALDQLAVQVAQRRLPLLVERGRGERRT